MTERRTGPLAQPSATPPANPSTPSAVQPAFVPFLTGPDLPDDLIRRLCDALCPPLLASVDMPAFVRLIGASHSLSAIDKWRVFDGLPTLSQFQIDALIEVMDDEVSEFSKLVYREWTEIAGLSARSWLHLCMVADHLGVGYADEAAERKALALMLRRKYRGEGRSDWVHRARGTGPLAGHVFSTFDSTPVAKRKPSLGNALPESF